MTTKLGNNPKLFRLKAFTGPTCVGYIADALRKQGAVDVIEGTENVYWTISGDSSEHAVYRTLEFLKRDYPTSFGLIPQCLRELP